jgi:glycogen(starch) synthase
MRVLLISWEYPPNVVGGMGKHVADLAPALAGQMADDGPIYVDVLTTRFSGGAQEEQVSEFLTLYRVDVPPIDPVDHYNSVVESNQGLIAFAEQLGERHTYDLLHAHDWLVAKAGIALKHRWKTPLITTIHATERGRHQGHIPSDSKLADRPPGVAVLLRVVERDCVQRVHEAGTAELLSACRTARPSSFPMASTAPG